MNTPKTARERFVSFQPPEKQVEADRILQRLSHDENEPIIWIFSALTESQIRSYDTIKATIRAEVAAQFTEHKRIILAMYHPKTWQKILLSRFLSWVVIPSALFMIATGVVHFLRLSETRALRDIARNPDGYAAYAQYSKEAVEIANNNTAAISAIAALLNVPSARAAVRDGKIVIVVPNNSISISKTARETQISLSGDTRKILEILSGISVNTKLKAANDKIP